jgi:hypothetical protein
MLRLKLVASGVFFVGFLGFQIVYPTLAWFLPGYTRFTWHMYAGRRERPQYAVVYTDGTRQELQDPLRPGGEILLYGPSVDEPRFVPPFICAEWEDVREVRLAYPRAGREDVVACGAQAP